VKDYDLVIIGAGPAGMAAAALAAAQGATIALIDEQPTAGGQIYRNLSQADPEQLRILGPDYRKGQSLIDGLVTHNVTHINAATVWDVTEDLAITYSQNGEARQIAGQFVLIATGALERPVPVPGWTLPGVMTAGAAQIMLKTSGLLAEDAVLAGSGPLLYLLAAQMIAAKSPPKAIVETQTRRDMINAFPELGGAMRGWKAIAKGVGLLKTIRQAGIRRYRAAQDIAVIGSEKATALRFRSQGDNHELPCSTVLLHQGVVPNTQITRALRLDHLWNPAQRCFHPVLNDWGKTGNDRIFVAGDGAGINGARAAELAGRLCAAEILHQLGKIDRAARDAISRPVRKTLNSERAVRPFLDALYPPPEQILLPANDTIICRCEEVRAGDVRRYAKLGCIGPNQTKAFGRCGMGPCQGRYCALTVTELLATENNLSQQAVGSYRIRSPLKPVTLGEVASLQNSPDGK